MRGLGLEEEGVGVLGFKFLEFSFDFLVYVLGLGKSTVFKVMKCFVPIGVVFFRASEVEFIDI